MSYVYDELHFLMDAGSSAEGALVKGPIGAASLCRQSLHVVNHTTSELPPLRGSARTSRGRCLERGRPALCGKT